MRRSRALRQPRSLDDADEAERLFPQSGPQARPGGAALPPASSKVWTVLTVDAPEATGELQRHRLASPTDREHDRNDIIASLEVRSNDEDPAMALRWTAAGMIEAAKGFRV